MCIYPNKLQRHSFTTETLDPITGPLFNCRLLLLESGFLRKVARFYEALQTRQALFFPGLDVAGLALDTDQNDTPRHFRDVERLGRNGVVFRVFHIIQ